MVKLASARECRQYGSIARANNRWEYINAGLYVFACVLLLAGAALRLLGSGRPSVVVLLLSVVIVALVNVHDLFAHLAGIDFRLPLMHLDTQFLLVEVAAPVVQVIASVLMFLAFIFLFAQGWKGNSYNTTMEMHALNLLVVGPAFWLLGSIHNACQVYERADAHFQVLQKMVYIPFMMGSLLFLVGGIMNKQTQDPSYHHGIQLLGKSWAWFALSGSVLFLIGGLGNLTKVFKMQQMEGGLRLEKLRGGAQERLGNEREGSGISRMPLIHEEQQRRTRFGQGSNEGGVGASAPYKDALLSQS